MAAINKDLSIAQIEKFQLALNKKLKAARKRFTEDNIDYKDIELNSEVVSVLKVLGPKATDDREGQVRVANLRLDAMNKVAAGVDLPANFVETLDLLTVKTEQDLPESAKFKTAAYLPVKKYTFEGKIWKTGYGFPEADYTDPKTNTFVDADGEHFQILRSAGLLQLMTEDDIDVFTENVVVTFNDYFKMFF